MTSQLLLGKASANFCLDSSKDAVSARIGKEGMVLTQRSFDISMLEEEFEVALLDVEFSEESLVRSR